LPISRGFGIVPIPFEGDQGIYEIINALVGLVLEALEAAIYPAVSVIQNQAD
jgi:hypothetical protein